MPFRRASLFRLCPFRFISSFVTRAFIERTVFCCRAPRITLVSISQYKSPSRIPNQYIPYLSHLLSILQHLDSSPSITRRICLGHEYTRTDHRPPFRRRQLLPHGRTVPQIASSPPNRHKSRKCCLRVAVYGAVSEPAGTW